MASYPNFKNEGNAEWQALGRMEPQRGRGSAELHQIALAIADMLAVSNDPLLEGAWIDVTSRPPIWIDAAVARRQAGLPDLPGRRVVGSGVD
jgi:hypothetical protein